MILVLFFCFLISKAVGIGICGIGIGTDTSGIGSTTSGIGIGIG